MAARRGTALTTMATAQADAKTTCTTNCPRAVEDNTCQAGSNNTACCGCELRHSHNSSSKDGNSSSAARKRQFSMIHPGSWHGMLLGQTARPAA
ncbi:hypothetical protein [Andreprevotia lacus]|uniref:hypothetical protein n=1 Tax=Andreprevotia lacus TaxID=1121000 RepID=UPI00111BDEA7|nr:hypothetical protein [Andreprevotia lacus]